jgi:hypothetical protein
MRKPIPVVDITSGETSERASDTPTLDVPFDLNRAKGIVSVDSASRGRYRALEGQDLEYPVFTRPLSWRARGEECLVAEAGVHRKSALFRLSLVEPASPPI